MNTKQCIFIPLTLPCCLKTVFGASLPRGWVRRPLAQSQRRKREHEIKSLVSSTAKTDGEICEIAWASINMVRARPGRQTAKSLAVWWIIILPQGLALKMVLKKESCWVFMCLCMCVVALALAPSWSVEGNPEGRETGPATQGGPENWGTKCSDIHRREKLLGGVFRRPCPVQLLRGARGHRGWPHRRNGTGLLAREVETQSDPWPPRAGQ